MRFRYMFLVLLCMCSIIFSSSALDEVNHITELDPPNPTEPFPPSNSVLGVYSSAAVAANSVQCADIGRDVLLEGGNAVDAAIAALFCEGITNSQSMGLGGGFFMTIYNKTTGESFFLNAREVAPGAAYPDMFNGNGSLSTTGGLATAVPGELRGYWEAYNKFGSLPWHRLVEPSIAIAANGVVVNSYVASRLQSKEDEILESETMSEILIDPNTGHVYVTGDVIKRPGLAQTLRVIASEGGDALYTGSLSQPFLNDLKDLGSIITAQDLANYQVRWETPVNTTISNNMTLITSPAPSSGPVLAFIMNVLDGFIPGPDKVTTYQRLIESLKWGYGQRTRLGDPHFVDISDLLAKLTSKDFALAVRDQIFDTRTFDNPAHYGARTEPVESHGTAHISILAPDGSAVSVTSTHNDLWGAMIRSRSTDVILNDEMDDFSAPNMTNRFGLPPSPENFISPGKRPVSSLAPTIIVDSNGDVQLVVGAAGGSKSLSLTTSVIARTLWYGNETIKESIDAPRIHHQLFPMAVEYEYGTLQDIVKKLELIGHNTTRCDPRGTFVIAVKKDGDDITANGDYRRLAAVSGF